MSLSEKPGVAAPALIPLRIPARSELSITTVVPPTLLPTSVIPTSDVPTSAAPSTAVPPAVEFELMLDTAGERPRQTLSGYGRLALVADLLVATLAATAAVLIRTGNAPGIYRLLPVGMPVAWVAAVAFERAYEHRFLGEGPEEFRRIAWAGLLLFTIVAVWSYTADGNFSRTVALISVPTTVICSLAVRRVLRSRLRRLRAAGRGLHRTIIVGHHDPARHMIDTLRLAKRHLSHHGLRPIGVCLPSSEVAPSHVEGIPVLGRPDDILAAVDATGADVVAVVSHPDLSGHRLRRLSWALEERGVELLVSPGLLDVAQPRLSIRAVDDLSLLHLERPEFTGGRRLLKTAFDLGLAALGLLLISPVLLTIAVLIRMTSPGPALFKQTRVSTNGTHFKVYKFRSMVVDAEARRTELAHQNEGNGVLFKLKRDPRVTRVGAVLRRYSLDELPQLLNVLNGSMSLIGPRPPLPSEVAIYSDDETRRLRVKPGMTGLWQVSGRSDLSREDSLRLDLQYVDNWSLALDLSILWRTVRAVTHGSGAY